MSAVRPSPLNGFARFQDWVLLGEANVHVGRLEPRPFGITKGRL
jgi:hypothetical protein